MMSNIKAWTTTNRCTASCLLNFEVVDIIKLVANCKLVDNTKMVSNIKVGDNTREKRLVTIFCQNRAGGRKVIYSLAAFLPDELILQPS